jgi:hypothetical protein
MEKLDESNNRLWKQKFEHAKSHHLADNEQTSLIYSSVLEFALLALRTVTIMAGGAVAISLAFVGALYSLSPDIALKLMVPVMIFAAGGILGGVASVVGYISQYYYFNAAASVTHIWEHPYIEYKKERDVYQSRSDIWRIGALAVVVLSYACLAFGTVYSLMIVGDFLTPTLHPAP